MMARWQMQCGNLSTGGGLAMRIMDRLMMSIIGQMVKDRPTDIFQK